ncbi:hypothetical protein Sjap_006625 [Stephania japonica]|uniref:Uncharacterized protein n=1 Tax=Stephania japonica TaxID=461633 RepID=A0AAP0PJX5_9MAGN
MKAVAEEFSALVTCFLNRIDDDGDKTTKNYDSRPRFQIRCFNCVAEVNICGHAISIWSCERQRVRVPQLIWTVDCEKNIQISGVRGSIKNVE